jgi:Protein of unknown function (DUF2523)
MNLYAFFANLAGPIAARVLMAMGMGVISVTGVTAAVDTLKAQIIDNLGAAPMAALQLAGLSGCWVALGLVFGAVTFAVTFAMLTKLSGFVSKV